MKYLALALFIGLTNCTALIDYELSQKEAGAPACFEIVTCNYQIMPGPDAGPMDQMFGDSGKAFSTDVNCAKEVFSYYWNTRDSYRWHLSSIACTAPTKMIACEEKVIFHIGTDTEDFFELRSTLGC